MSLDKAITFLRNNGDEIINFASKLISIPSVNPPGDMTEIASFIKDYLGSWGLDVKWIEPKKGKITLLSSIGDGDELLMLNGHMDVVPPGDVNKWKHPPFSGKIVGEYLYGRGASDMKGPLASMIFAYIAFAQNFSNLDHKVSFSIVPDEETGGQYGVGYLVEVMKLKPKYVLIGEPSTIYVANIGEKGILWLRFRVDGKPGHASLSPYVGQNAIVKAMDVIKEIYELTKVNFEPPQDIKETAVKSGEIVAKTTKNRELRRIFYSLSCNVGVIKGGVKVNVVAPYCEFDVDLRIPHGASTNDIINLVKNQVASKFNVKFEVVAKEEPNYTSPKSKLLEKLSIAAKEELNVEITPTLITGATDGRYFRCVGSDVIIYGPADWLGIHGYDEKVRVDELKAASRIYLRAISYLVKDS